jgi:hypothetical protein
MIVLQIMYVLALLLFVTPFTTYLCACVHNERDVPVKIVSALVLAAVLAAVAFFGILVFCPPL